jgi:hypothetical protein
VFSPLSDTQCGRCASFVNPCATLCRFRSSSAGTFVRLNPVIDDRSRRNNIFDQFHQTLSPSVKKTEASSVVGFDVLVDMVPTLISYACASLLSVALVHASTQSTHVSTSRAFTARDWSWRINFLCILRGGIFDRHSHCATILCRSDVFRAASFGPVRIIRDYPVPCFYGNSVFRRSRPILRRIAGLETTICYEFPYYYCVINILCIFRHRNQPRSNDARSNYHRTTI